jgi:hypothetical protein
VLDSTGFRELGGSAATALASDAPGWMHRRVESIEFVDNRVVRRRVSVDFTIPQGLDAAEERDGGHLFYVPVGALAKLPPLLTLDLFGADGNPTHLLTTVQNSAMDEGLLLGLMGLCGAADESHVARLIKSLAGTRGDRQAIFNELCAANLGDGPDGTDRVRKRLLFFAEQMTDHFLLWFPIVGKAGDRVVVKFEYDHFDESTRDPLRRLLRSLSWVPRDKYYVIPQAGIGGSYHLAIETPPLLEVKHVDVGFIQSKDDPSVVADTQVDGPRVHLYVPGPRVARGFVSLATVATRRGMLSAALSAAIAVTLLLAALALARAEVAKEPEAAIAIQLIVPALLGAFVVRPADHPLVGEHVSKVRVLALFVGLLPTIGAVITLGYNDRPTCIGWAMAALAALAAMISLVLAVSWRVASPNFPEGRP